MYHPSVENDRWNSSNVDHRPSNLSSHRALSRPRHSFPLFQDRVISQIFSGFRIFHTVVRRAIRRAVIIDGASGIDAPPPPCDKQAAGQGWWSRLRRQCFSGLRRSCEGIASYQQKDCCHSRNERYTHVKTRCGKSWGCTGRRELLEANYRMPEVCQWELLELPAPEPGKGQ